MDAVQLSGIDELKLDDEQFPDGNIGVLPRSEKPTIKQATFSLCNPHAVATTFTNYAEPSRLGAYLDEYEEIDGVVRQVSPNYRDFATGGADFGSDDEDHRLANIDSEIVEIRSMTETMAQDISDVVQDSRETIEKIRCIEETQDIILHNLAQVKRQLVELVKTAAEEHRKAEQWRAEVMSILATQQAK